MKPIVSFMNHNPANAARFFASSAHNLHQLTQVHFQHYCQSVPRFPILLSMLQQKNIAKNHKPINYGMDDFILSANYSRSKLLCTPLNLIARPLPEYLQIAKPKSITFQLNTQSVSCFVPMLPKIQSYVQIFMDVFNNQLAGRNYEVGLPTQENVTERQHGMQAGKLAFAIGMTSSDILSLMFHDISRTSHPDQHYSHEYHHVESSVILRPLDLTQDYSSYHSLAKYLLANFCPEYDGLLSPQSRMSLLQQTAMLEPILATLDNFASTEDLAKFIYEIMFKRLLDDSSKVPQAKIIRYWQSQTQPIYFNDKQIEAMLINQLVKSQAAQLAACSNIEDTLDQFDEKLNQALQLLLRAEAYSNQPQLYEEFHQKFSATTSFRQRK